MRDTFDRLALDYDELKVRIIPGYREVQDLALRYATAKLRRRVLELGCGTGEWAMVFLSREANPGYVVGVEFSPMMRELASARLAPHAVRITLLDRDLNSSLPAGPFDLVVSFFAIHHIRDKQALVHDVFSALDAGGVFLYADISVAPDPELEQAFLDGWVSFMRNAGLDAERISQVLCDHRENDIPEPASVQLTYLRAAGFAAEIIWRREKFVLFYAVKPTSDALNDGAGA